MRNKLITAIASAALAVGLLATPALAAKGGGEETTLGNNLSVPTVFVPSTTGAPALRIACPSAYKQPGWDGVPTSTQFPGYWLQKTEATWTADCTTAASASVVADWGDNLFPTEGSETGALVAGKPLRIEVSMLDAAATGMRGYTVINLTPDLPDRQSTYGTDGTYFVTGDAGALLARVWTANATLTIEKQSGTNWDPVISDAAIAAEVNSTGAIVYGYNWGSKGRKNTPAAGTYKVTFTVPSANGVTFTGVADEGATWTANSTSVVFTLVAGNRGGGQGSGGGQGGGGGHQGGA